MSRLSVRSPVFVIVFNFRYLFGFSAREPCQLHPAMRKYKRGLRRNLQAVFPDTAPNSMPPRGEARCPLPQAAPTQAHQPVSQKAAAHRGTVRKHAQNRSELFILPHFKRLRIPSPFGFFDFAVSAVVNAASVFRKPRADFPKLFNRRFGEIPPCIRADVQNHVSAL